jgi:hypothetical protein
MHGSTDALMHSEDYGGAVLSAVIVSASQICRSAASHGLTASACTQVGLSSHCAVSPGRRTHRPGAIQFWPLTVVDLTLSTRPAGWSGAASGKQPPCRSACAAFRAGWRSACKTGRSEAPIRGRQATTSPATTRRTMDDAACNCCRLHCAPLGCLQSHSYEGSSVHHSDRLIS